MNSHLQENCILSAHRLSKTVTTEAGSLHILSDIELQIQTAESLAILGVSGSGKSTLLGLLAGLDLPSSGKVVLAGQDLGQLDEDGRARLRARTTGFVFQSFQLLPGLTALENVLLPLELAGHENPEPVALNILRRVGLEHRGSHYPLQLSGGEQQRVAIARGFALQPALLFADEPTGNLDSKTGAQIIDLLFELNQERGATLILVTHDPHLAGRCSRRIHLEGGRMLPELPA